jgi:hypothetical protein
MTKLTLSIPEESVEKVKTYAKQHGTNVSAFFRSVIEALPDEDQKGTELLKEWPEMQEVLHSSVELVPFDERSAGLLRKHG